MAIIKCKMCGGTLALIEGSTIAQCEYCGSVQTVPALDDEKKLIQFERAERLRKQCEFDKAAGIYESIVEDFHQEAEAYWGLVLCKYGVEYVDDPATGKKIPTCHRSSFDSILEDSDFEQVLENAETAARKVYRDEAKQIEEIRKGVIAVSANEEPYDIFICYKETDEKGQRTIDSVLAQDLYVALTEKGYRVFFSRITLEDIAGKQYEPYIFAALNSAKVMVVLGTKPEYMNAAWVKNEWSRFLTIMKKDRSKLLLPCYRDMAPYDMPEQLCVLQSYDMGRIGFLQDLIRGIKKVLDEPQKPIPTVVKPDDRQRSRNNVAILLIALIFVSIVAIGATLWAVGAFDILFSGEKEPPVTTAPTLPAEVPCESLAVSGGKYSLQDIGDTITIVCTKTPANSTDEIAFVSEDATVATVDQNGIVTAVKNGTTNILIACGDVVIACEVVVGDGCVSTEVPLLNGRDIQEAKRILQEKGFPEPQINKVYSSQSAGIVVSQNPSANAVVSAETVVVLEVSKGPKPVETAPSTPKPTPEPTPAAELVVWHQFGPLYHNDLTLQVGESAILYLGNSDGTGNRITVNWTCGENEYISVSGNTVTALQSLPNDYITVITEYEGMTYRCRIRVH